MVTCVERVDLVCAADSAAFFGLAGDPWSEAALAHLRTCFSEVRPFLGTNAVPQTDPDPGIIGTDWLFSFKTKTIFRPGTLDSIRKASINFHTASPDYPGSGGVNWLLYNGDATSGITVHRVSAAVDAGPILRVDGFSLAGLSSVTEVLALTYARQLATFLDVTTAIAAEGEGWLARAELASAGVCWGPRTYRLRDLDDLKRITPDMTEAEVARRIRATRYGQHGPFVEVGGRRYRFVGDAP